MGAASKAAGETVNRCRTYRPAYACRAMRITKKFVRQVLHQAFGMHCGSAMEIYAEAWCLRDVGVDDWNKLIKHMVDEGLVRESGEPEYYRMTEKAEDLMNHRE